MSDSEKGTEKLTVLEDDEIHALVAKFDVNVVEEASYILWYIWKDRYCAFKTLQACIAALSSDETLYQSLKDAHGGRCYAVIRDWSTFGAPISIF